ncbi:hypothetical protein CB1_007024007 [Camelus ferus]|nr:hypothetical protein CB1_007024007 [Camelus ferus]
MPGLLLVSLASCLLAIKQASPISRCDLAKVLHEEDLDGFEGYSLSDFFSQFGLTYSVGASPNVAVACPGFYAIIEFYSARDARRAQKACDQKQLFQNSPVKVGPNVEFLAPQG